MSDAEVARKIAKRRERLPAHQSVTVPSRVSRHDPARYHSLTDREIAHELRHIHGRLLLRGRLETLLARREIGGLLCEFAGHHPRDRKLFEVFCLQNTGLGYDDGRRHMKLWVFWHHCFIALERLEQQAKRNGVALAIPGLRKLLVLAGVVGKRPASQPPESRIEEDIDWIVPARLPDDVDGLREVIRRLEQINRTLREKVVILTNDLSLARQQIGQMPNRR
jgi:hypothetical protein